MGHGPHCCYFYFIVFEVLLGPNLKEKLLENSFSPCWSYYNIAILSKLKENLNKLFQQTGYSKNNSGMQMHKGILYSNEDKWTTTTHNMGVFLQIKCWAKEARHHGAYVLLHVKVYCDIENIYSPWCALECPPTHKTFLLMLLLKLDPWSARL